MIDVDYGRLSVEDESKLKVFKVRGQHEAGKGVMLGLPQLNQATL